MNRAVFSRALSSRRLCLVVGSGVFMEFEPSGFRYLKQGLTAQSAKGEAQRAPLTALRLPLTTYYNAISVFEFCFGSQAPKITIRCNYFWLINSILFRMSLPGGSVSNRIMRRATSPPPHFCWWMRMMPW